MIDAMDIPEEEKAKIVQKEADSANNALAVQATKTIIVDAPFDEGLDGFSFKRRMFGGVKKFIKPNFNLEGPGAESIGVTLGGWNHRRRGPISGGWYRNFTLDHAANITVLFDYSARVWPGKFSCCAYKSNLCKLPFLTCLEIQSCSLRQRPVHSNQGPTRKLDGRRHEAPR